MTEKRFILINCTKPGTRSNILDYQKKHNEGVGDELWLGEVVDMLNQLTEENEQLKQELFESEKDYIMETYSDNPIRRDEKIQLLKEEFKEKFGDFE